MRTVNAKSMNALLLDHLWSVGDISNLEAQGMFKCRALPRRIADLKEAGHIIESRRCVDRQGQRYVRYKYIGDAS